MLNQPSPNKFMRWFDPRHRTITTWGFILNRITALGLTLYLVMHLFMLGKLAQGPQAYDSFIAFAKNPFFKIGEMLVIAAGLIHGINGIRIALNSFGIGVRYQKAMLVTAMVIAVAITTLFGFVMFSE